MSAKVTYVEDFDPDDELRPEYDLSKMQVKGRGLYAERYHAATQNVKLDDDVWAYFKTSEAVNEALRILIRLNELTQKERILEPA